MDRRDITEDLLKRFWAKVEKTGTCWLWTAYCQPNQSKRFTAESGYGAISVGGRKGRPHLAHLVSWIIHYGDIPPGMCVLHSCDVRNCVRPDHLWLGTISDNVLDAIAKGRLWTREERLALAAATSARNIGNKYGAGRTHNDRRGIEAARLTNLGSKHTPQHKEAIRTGLQEAWRAGKRVTEHSPKRREKAKAALDAAILQRKTYTGPVRAPGERNGSAKLSENEVRAIRQQYLREGTSFASLGRAFGITETMARNIVFGKSWTHVSS